MCEVYSYIQRLQKHYIHCHNDRGMLDSYAKYKVTQNTYMTLYGGLGTTEIEF